MIHFFLESVKSEYQRFKQENRRIRKNEWQFEHNDYSITSKYKIK